MKLTKAKQKQLDEAYDTLIQVCLYDRPLKDMEPFLADDVMNFGAGRKELTKTKTAFLRQIKNQKKLAAGLKMDFQIKPVLRKIINNGDGAIYTDDIVNTVWVNDVKNKLKFRLSFIFEYKENKWIMVHSHTSTPDSQRTDDEVWPVEELKKRTEALEKSLDEKIAELEIKNRELEIEAAVERVRGKAMAMHRSEDILNVAISLREEMVNLDLPGVSAATIFLEQDNGNFRVWDLTKLIDSADEPQLSLDIEFNPDEIDPDLFFLKFLRSTEKYFVVETNEADYVRWAAWYRSYDPAGADKFLQFLETSNFKHAWHTAVPLENGRLKVDFILPPSPEMEFILPKMAAAFDLAYKRFLDLQKAEAQTREAQIELGLEKVRARAMAMQKSGELSELVDTVFKELTKLDFALTWCIINIIDEPSMSNMVWAASPDIDKAPESYHMLFEDYPFHHAMMKGWKERKTKYVYVLEGLEKKVYDEYLFNETEFRKVPEAAQAASSAMEKYVVSFSFSNFGGLQTVGDVPLSDANLDILSRFGKVFDLTYTRFNDLKQAEAQARESQIQLSLERVRASAMAMHHSDELSDVLSTLFEQFDILDIRPVDAHLDLFDLEKNTFSYRATGKEGKRVIAEQIVDLDSRPEWQSLAERWKQGKPDTVGFSYYPKEVIRDLMAFFPDIWAAMPSEAIMNPEEDFPDGIYDALGYCKFGYLGFHHNRKTTEEENRILIRFANEFERLYQRFLDLQKAEAQAREAQIQLALERVRARTMAMQHSDELKDAAALLFQQAKSLGVPAYSCGYNIWEKNEKEFTSWMSTQDGSDFNAVLNIPLTEDANFIRFADSRQKGEQFFVLELRGERMQEHYRYLKTIPAFKAYFDYAVSVGFDLPETQIHHIANFSQGNLLFITLEPCPEFHDVFKRFAAVFEQTYTRFLDLQKAEAQARESQIQLALERVRARTMAMQKSDELAETASLLFKQINELGILTWTSGFNIWQENDTSFTGYNPTPSGGITAPYQIPSTQDSFFINIYEAKKRREDFLVFESAGDSLANTYQYMKTLPVVKDILKGIEDSGFQLPTFQINHCSFFSHGFLLFITLEAYPEAHEIFKRFGKVFEQTYTRFLDLQNAEAQVREAQIELGLERVRARAMAMQTSDELTELVAILFEELTRLDLILARCIIWIFDNTSLAARMWMANSEDKKIAKSYFIMRLQHSYYDAILRGWKEKHTKWMYDLKGEEKRSVDQLLLNETELSQLPDAVKKGILSSEETFVAGSFNNFGLIEASGPARLTDEQLDILNRFGKVFDLSYTRFNDLKNAEAQTRESQIELSLERVRARTMGMQKSEELKEVIQVVYEQFVHLNINIEHTGFIIDYKARDDMHIWLADRHEVPSEVTIPYFDCAHWNSFNEAKEKGMDFFANHLSFEEKNRFYQDLFKLIPGLPEEAKEYYFSCPGLAISTVLLENVGLYIENFSGIPYTDEENNTLMRFGKVFQQTYTRFLDLQKAEAQAREAQIEGAVERVRSRTMAMHRSEEIADILGKIFEELKRLDVVLNRILIWIFNHEERYISWWSANSESESNAESYRVDYNEHLVFLAYLEAWQNRVPLYLYTLSGHTKDSWEDHLFNNTGLSKLPRMVQNGMRAEGTIFTTSAISDYGLLMAGSLEPLSHENTDIIQRFGRVFQQSYTRYLDVQKAEAQAREAKIEAALERVRARSMAMHSSNELIDASDVMFDELDKLNIPTIRVGIGIVDLTKNEIEIWSRFDKNKMIEDQVRGIVPAGVHLWVDNLLKAKKENKPYTLITLRGLEVKNFYEQLSGYLSYRKQEAYNQKETIHSFFFKEGSLNVVSHEQLTEEQCNIMLRFARVFGQMYTRFLDLQKAEAQAREAQIEAALERVRSRTMGMQNSNELPQAANLLFQQIRSLGMPAWSAGYCIWDPDKKAITLWMSSEDVIQPKLRMPLTEDPSLMHFLEAHQRGDSFFVEEVGGEDLKKHYEYLRTLPGVKETLDDIAEAGFPVPTFQIFHLAYFSYGFLLFITYEPVPGAHDIFKRFGKVFDQTYTRFLDLQKAEAQAREAKIEAALERVRSRTMGMQHSEELSNTASEMFKQVQALGMHPWACGFNIFDKDEKAVTQWMSLADGGISPPFRTPLTEDPFFISIYEARQRREDLLVMESSGKELEETYRYMFSLPDSGKIFGDIEESGFEMPKFQITHCAYFSLGYLVFITYEHVKESWDIFKRFAKVFEQTYTRFLDLQKAEAQAREAQIEAALEKVRSRTMAMQHSEELLDVASILFQQVKALGVPQVNCGFNIWDIGEKEFTFYPGSTDFKILQTPCKIPLTEHPVFMRYDESRKRGDELLVYEKQGEEQTNHYSYMLSLPGVGDLLRNMLDAGFDVPTFQIDHVANFSYGNLIFITYEHFPEMHSVFKRFAKVFEQTYTRFLDLQKAEAQAREAQIEAALEKVRSRTMAMQHSEELLDVASILFQQVKALGVPQWNCGFNIWDIGDKEFTYYPGSPDGKILPTPCKIPLNEHPVFMRFDESRKRGDELLIYEKQGEEQADHYRYMLSLPGVGDLLRNMLDAGFELPTFQIDHVANFSYGNLIFITYEHFPEMHNVFKRFAKVFEQTYTRFLDLQKAEVQAREAQIEAALEKVRAKVMAMKNSSELNETSFVFGEQLRKLGIDWKFSYFWLIEEEKDKNTFWITWPDNQTSETSYSLAEADESFQECIISWKRQDRMHASHVPPPEVAGWLDTFDRISKDAVGAALEIMKPITFKDGVFYYDAMIKFGSFGICCNRPVTDEEQNIQCRFAVEFERAYTRFLDLKKAEAQAREAEIELALERVRAKTMAMQKSDELQEVVHTVFERLKELNIDFYTAIIILFKEDSRDIEWWLENKENQQYPRILVPYANINLLENSLEARETGKELHTKCYAFEEKNELFHHLFEHTDFKYVPEDQKKFLLGNEFATMSVAFAKNTGINITSYSRKSFSDKDNEILKRFAKVFDQAYTRFLDLQKAEAQAREAKIEAGLERVRARTMAMHNSEDVSIATATMFNELEKLNIQNFRGGILNIKPDETMEVWSVNTLDDGSYIRAVGIFDMTMHPFWQQLYEGWKKKIEFFSFDMSGKDKEEYIKILDVRRDYLPNGIQHLPDSHVQSYFFGEGFVWTFSLQPHSEEEQKLMKRFASVFSLTFRRYQDLLKAEAQAREAKIEASLERVRAKAMAMHSSHDLDVTIEVFYQELKALDVAPKRCGMALLDRETRIAEMSSININEMGSAAPTIGRLKLEGHPVLDAVFENWLLQKEYHPVLRGNEIKEYYEIIKPQVSLPDYSNDLVQFGYYFYFQEGNVFAWSEKEFGEEELSIFRRFTSVLSLTYRRYQDLKKAEAQARESQIEAALERVRSKAMAMHSSQDLASTIGVFYNQLGLLGITPRRCGVCLMYKETRQADILSMNTTEEGNSVEVVGTLDMATHPVLQGVYENWLLQQEWFTVLRGEEIAEYYRVLRPQIDYPDYSNDSIQYGNVFPFKEGGLYAWTGQPLTERDLEIYRRFTSVLSLTYKRYQDLIRAEANAREATIEAALERVRARAMAMHNSADLSTTASTVFSELRKLGITSTRNGVGMLSKTNRKVTIYAATSSEDGDHLSIVGSIMLQDHPVLSEIYERWLRREDYFPVLQGELLASYYEKVLSAFDITDPSFAQNLLPNKEKNKDPDHRQYGYFMSFSEGYMFGWSDQPYTKTELSLLKRFVSVIDLTFRRYMELQKSEASAREAVKQAALDRIRADIASMRAVKDLDRITPLIWNELTVLGVSFIRCGIFLMDDSQKMIHTFLSAPDGKAIGAFHLPYSTPGKIQEVLHSWKRNSIYTDHWEESHFGELATILAQQGAIASEAEYLNSLPRGGFFLHFLPFLQGMLYVGSLSPLPPDQIDLLQSVAEAFSTAYARYEDFNRLEAAKQQVDRTLEDLKQAQTQLIQSEKMASLGELTAGIAHEIQNPLNFVNNFSEVNTELLEELKSGLLDKLSDADKTEAAAIINDLNQNLEKITHHGRRADAIVKGMLQHSRISSGQKELTAINTLADEYLRLAYHGLRAKDKSFNASFKTDFDESVGKISVIPQDIGRVILNLINNAFQAVSEKKKHAENGYEPTVSISTRKTDDKIEIKIIDNGIGISPRNLDKIFQPFFTTKPTGQGTGLGLSLAYDIVTKGHGGELRVDTEEGKGSVFTVQLPINDK